MANGKTLFELLLGEHLDRLGMARRTVRAAFGGATGSPIRAIARIRSDG
jgi:hypothetical protein